MYYEINIAKNGKHFFATAKRSITTKSQMLAVMIVLEDKFPEDEGYEIMVSYYEEVGRRVNQETWEVE